ncbi:MAG: hypothetical protein A3B34_00905 [Candidatus Sungbacteria bacterium RIFCSPLOWO2_01_FULL_54_21]|uniref:Uncharacterized protein n=2 Tax=Candidatus Sungiibacteriota TaxID=1817917 RepID=A0A1G2L8K9_9BACT|nr:MAG: hypothetical protein A2679_03470 [Candidatus Sungbacteria bacterium RIFCSPHIGHO2_01_FULL_54_26]OHA04001.1 MAG: hypothetical protein A3C92_03595 [Candidatus Sungbacteria bacterium RIFCSPHIGHO2_02_FULL_53_17]OHA07978.1 MAG: hypothetical protein A3B34_00905 [Candidatus Sungbacteria bacterium RIFCSPLOWO2_01_FULL_54_21]
MISDLGDLKRISKELRFIIHQNQYFWRKRNILAALKNTDLGDVTFSLESSALRRSLKKAYARHIKSLYPINQFHQQDAA